MKVIALFLCMLLPGCTLMPSKVLIPIQKPCLVTELPKTPHLAIEDLRASSPLNDVVKAYVASVKALKDHQKIVYSLVGGDNGKTM